MKAQSDAHVSSIWQSFAEEPVDITNCRAHGRFQFQEGRGREAYQDSVDRLSASARRLLPVLGEDGALGALAHTGRMGQLLTRDLIDSAAELAFLIDHLGWSALDAVIDIGSGYGRLAHRIGSLRGDARVICADQIESSRVACAAYLGFRGVSGHFECDFDGALKQVHQLRPSLATAIHSFPEMPLLSIEVWLALLGTSEVKWLFIVPNEPGDLASTEPDGSRCGFLPAIHGAGFELIATGWKYPDGERDPYSIRLVYQDQYLLFERR